MVDKTKTQKIKENIKSTKVEKKVEIKQDPKMQELKISLLKQTAKKKDIRREIARLLTLQNKNNGVLRESSRENKK